MKTLMIKRPRLDRCRLIALYVYVKSRSCLHDDGRLERLSAIGMRCILSLVVALMVGGCLPDPPSLTYPSPSLDFGIDAPDLKVRERPDPPPVDPLSDGGVLDGGVDQMPPLDDMRPPIEPPHLRTLHMDWVGNKPSILNRNEPRAIGAFTWTQEEEAR
jgi:hypothetical protein